MGDPHGRSTWEIHMGDPHGRSAFHEYGNNRSGLRKAPACPNVNRGAGQPSSRHKCHGPIPGGREFASSAERLGLPAGLRRSSCAPQLVGRAPAHPLARAGPMKSLFWLSYRRDNGSLGVVIVKAGTLLEARMLAAIDGVDGSADFSEGHELQARDAPPGSIGRMLPADEAYRLISWTEAEALRKRTPNRQSRRRIRKRGPAGLNARTGATRPEAIPIRSDRDVLQTSACGGMRA